MELFNSWVLLLEVQRHRTAKEACTVDRRGRFGPWDSAEKFVHQGEVSRARQALCSQARAPPATLNELTRNADHPDCLRPSPEVSRFWRHHQFQLDRGTPGEGSEPP